ncbi:glycoside hydrolase family 5 protein [Marinifilum sp. D737]|uniref:glycoside hydrolase family 5 protein n=1 Tax=Marinifilum sp. D737 TaxID=2969628 RepID=UPI002272C420|nr:glycoside hydrolase family 5 protein [Marinifilum sp. D737]MCY1633497.1 glycoside hydrolase family 5 protein [Marinifilum sp. D737]
MRQKILILIAALFVCGEALAKAPVRKHGKLKVVGRQLCDENGSVVQIKGMSSHGLYWFAHCMNRSSMEVLAKNWKVDAVRFALYPKNYKDNPAYYTRQVDELVEIAEELGLYCIIDWHAMDSGNPNKVLDDAKVFWEHMSKTHAGKEHVIYEICNEPNKTTWEEVKKYANVIIPLIRKNDKETVILVGTPDWSSNLAAAAKDPLNFENIMYTFHFYAKSHKNRKAFIEAIQQIPVFVSEWGTSSYNGDDGNDYESAKIWLDILAGNNPEQLKISWMNWNLSDKPEASSVFKPGSGVRQEWDQLTETGEWIKKQFGR